MNLPEKRLLDIQRLDHLSSSFSLPTNVSAAFCQFAFSPEIKSSLSFTTATGIEVLLPQELLALGARRRAEFFAGRAVAHETLESHGLRKPKVLRGHDGEPLWPSRIVGSIAHTDDFAGAVSASSSVYRSIGFDMEPCLSKEVAEEIMGEIATTAELEQACTRETCFSDKLTRIYVAKEAAFKAIFPLEANDWQFTDFQVVTAQSGFVTLRLPARRNPILELSTAVSVRTQKVDGLWLAVCAISQ